MDKIVWETYGGTMMNGYPTDKYWEISTETANTDLGGKHFRDVHKTFVTSCIGLLKKFSKVNIDGLKNCNIIGRCFRTANDWISAVPIDDYQYKPINYLEIGVHCGANIVCVANTYAKHPDSRIYCIDIWDNYDDYKEYGNDQPDNFHSFKKNISNCKLEDKVTIRKGYSNQQLLFLADDFFDIIYVDGNHESEYVLEDSNFLSCIF